MPSVERVKIDDYEGPNGTVDWQAYRKASIENGEKCRDCGAFIMSPSGHPSWCYDCNDARSNTGEINHNRMVRCPACRYMWAPGEHDDYELLSDEEHEVNCYECNHEFTITTNVSYSFDSPPLLNTEEE